MVSIFVLSISSADTHKRYKDLGCLGWFDSLEGRFYIKCTNIPLSSFMCRHLLYVLTTQKQQNNIPEPQYTFWYWSYLLDVVEEHKGDNKKGKTGVLILSLYLYLLKGFNSRLLQGG